MCAKSVINELLAFIGYGKIPIMLLLRFQFRLQRPEILVIHICPQNLLLERKEMGTVA